MHRLRRRPRWLELAWWTHLRHDYPDRLAVFAALAALGLAVGGYLSVAALGNGGSPVAGPPAAKAAPASSRSASAGSAADPRTVYRRRVVVRNGQGQTETVSRLIADPRTTTVVQPQTVVNGETAPARTVIRSETAPARTVVRSETAPARTVIQNQTAPAQTVTRTETAPARTVTVTGPGTTVTRTVVVTTTLTVTEPAVTVTVTLPIP